MIFQPSRAAGGRGAARGLVRTTVGFANLALFAALVVSSTAPAGAQPARSPGEPAQAYSEGGDRGFVAQETHASFLGSHSGAQSARHDQSVFVGSGRNGEGEADFAHSFSLVKRNWSSPSAAAGEGDVIRCDGRNGGPTTGPAAGLSDMNCITINIQNTKRSGYLAGIEASVSDVDPSRGFAIDHAVGFQSGVVNSRDGDYEGYVAISNAGTNDVAFHSLGSTDGSNFKLFLKETVACPNARAAFIARDVFTVDVAGTATWTPCPSKAGDAPAVSLSSDGGTLLVRNGVGAVVLAIDQSGNVSAGGALVSPTYTLAGLPRGKKAGRQAYCSDCLKPGERRGTGSGMMVFQDGTHPGWYTIAGASASD